MKGIGSMGAEQTFDLLVNVVLQGIVGMLVGGTILLINKIYLPHRARFHYMIAGSGLVIYFIGVLLFQGHLDVRRFFLVLALLFVVFYGNKARLYLRAMEKQLSHLNHGNTTGPMVCTVNVNIGGMMYQCQRYQYHHGTHEVITKQGTIKWTGVL